MCKALYWDLYINMVYNQQDQKWYATVPNLTAETRSCPAIPDFTDGESFCHEE